MGCATERHNTLAQRRPKLRRGQIGMKAPRSGSLVVLAFNHVTISRTSNLSVCLLLGDRGGTRRGRKNTRGGQYLVIVKENSNEEKRARARRRESVGGDSVSSKIMSNSRTWQGRDLRTRGVCRNGLSWKLRSGVFLTCLAYLGGGGGTEKSTKQPDKAKKKQTPPKPQKIPATMNYA